jgi:predicted SAM-dependent methyltransferase
MGRLSHLEQTYLKNIKDNEGGPDTEFVLLNYNSPDGLEEWAKANLLGLIKSNRVVYFREATARVYHSSHAKNLAKLLATGDVVVNLDADNWLGEGYAKKVAEVFESRRSVFTTCVGFSGGGAAGRIGLRRQDFLKLRGYDEALTGYGYDDIDLRVRCCRELGLREVRVSSPDPMAIEHGWEDRIRHMDLGMSLDRMTQQHKKNRELVQNRVGPVNPLGWGVATVYRKFESEPIRVGEDIARGRKFHFGCGENKLKGWENYDEEVDLRKKLPYPDGCADFVFTEHVFEHLSIQEGWNFLEEAFRILRPGGVIRLTVPCVVQVWKNQTEQYRNFLKSRNWGDGSRQSAIRHLVFLHGHKSLWTHDLLITILEAVGFHAKAVPLYTSEHPALVNVENHWRAIGKEANDLESISVEGTKP